MRKKKQSAQEQQDAELAIFKRIRERTEKLRQN